MGVLDAFLATWTEARATFGEGAPKDGSPFDGSPTLLGLQSEVHRAGPGDHWLGQGSDGYASANEEQARVLGDAASLDRRLAAEMDRAVGVVSTGRRDLDKVRQWVVDAAAAVPRTAEGDGVLYSTISRGSGEIVEILQRSHDDLNAIAGRIRGIDTDYQELGSATRN